MPIKKAKKPSMFSVLLGGLLLLFLLLTTLLSCSFTNTGKSVYCKSNENSKMVFATQKNSTKVKKIYVNVGSIYEEEGAPITFSVYRNLSTSSTPNILFGEHILGFNLYDEKLDTTKGNCAFTWLVFEAPQEEAVGSFYVTSTADFILNEVICTNEKGDILPLEVAKTVLGYTKEEVKLFVNALDRQVLPDFSAKTTFTGDEARTMTAIYNLKTKGYREGNVYHLERTFSPLATVIYLPFVSLFGDCTGALRLCSALFTALAIWLLYAAASILLKSKKWGLFSAFLFLISGLPFTAGIVGPAQSTLLCALLGGLYFILRFFSKGISTKAPIRGGFNVLFGGLCIAFALALQFVSIFAALGIGVLFYFGLRRQKAAHLLAKEKCEGEVEENKEVAVYKRKCKITYGFGVIGLVIGYLVFLLLSVLLAYDGMIRTYDAPAAPTLSLFELMGKNIEASFLAKPKNLTHVLFWLTPLRATPFIESKTFLFGAVFNPMISLLTWVSIFALIYKDSIIFSDKFFNKENMRVVRSSFVAFGGMLLLLVQAFLCATLPLAVICMASLLLPTFLSSIEAKGNARQLKAFTIATGVAVLVGFIFILPALFGFEGKIFVSLCGLLF